MKKDLKSLLTEDIQVLVADDMAVIKGGGKWRGGHGKRSRSGRSRSKGHGHGHGRSKSKGHGHGHGGWGGWGCCRPCK
jgi:hypothetical protein